VRAESSAPEGNSVTSAEATSGQRRTDRCLAGCSGWFLWFIELHFVANPFWDVRTGGVATLDLLATPTFMNHRYAHPIANSTHNDASFPLELRTGQMSAGFLNKRDGDFNAW